MGTNVIVLSFDVMPLSLLGCYGNEWALTPHFDQLAWEGVTFDQHFTADVDPARRQLGWWTGCAEAEKSSEEFDPRIQFLLRFLEYIPANLELGLDDSSAASAKKSRKKPTSSFERLLQHGLASIVTMRELGSSTMLWLHGDGLTEPVDPPPEYLELYLDELEDLPEDQRSLDLIHAAAAVSHLDHLFGHFRPQYEEQFHGEELIWIVTAAGSCPVGFEPDERFAAGRMSEGYIHTPLIIASSSGSPPSKSDAKSKSKIKSKSKQPKLEPNSATRSVISARNAGTRRQQLVQTIDLLPTLCDLFDVEWEDPVEGQSLLPLLNDAAFPSRDHLVIHENQRRAGVRTETEFLVCRAAKDAKQWVEDDFGKEVLLYRKPEDRWEQSDVSRMEPDLTVRLLPQIFPAPP